MGFFDFLGSVGDLFGEIAAYLGALFAYLWDVMVQLFTFLWNTLVALADAIAGVFQAAGKFLASLWNDYIKPAITKILQLYEKLRALISKWIAPIMRWVQKIRAWYNTYVFPWQKRMLNLIQHVRQFLGVLKALHVKWATKLDADLAKIQQDIAKSISLVVQTLNGVVNWLTIIANPLLLVASLTHSAWVVGFVDTLMRTLLGAGYSSFLGRVDTTGNGNLGPGKFSTLTDRMHDDTTSGTGDFHQINLQSGQTWNRFTADLSK